jgi:hypothetical protein
LAAQSTDLTPLCRHASSSTLAWPRTMPVSSGSGPQSLPSVCGSPYPRKPFESRLNTCVLSQFWTLRSDPVSVLLVPLHYKTSHQILYRMIWCQCSIRSVLRLILQSPLQNEKALEANPHSSRYDWSPGLQSYLTTPALEEAALEDQKTVCQIMYFCPLSEHATPDFL